MAQTTPSLCLRLPATDSLFRLTRDLGVLFIATLIIASVAAVRNKSRTLQALGAALDRRKVSQTPPPFWNSTLGFEL